MDSGGADAGEAAGVAALVGAEASAWAGAGKKATDDTETVDEIMQQHHRLKASFPIEVASQFSRELELCISLST